MKMDSKLSIFKCVKFQAIGSPEYFQKSEKPTVKEDMTIPIQIFGHRACSLFKPLPPPHSPLSHENNHTLSPHLRFFGHDLITCEGIQQQPCVLLFQFPRINIKHHSITPSGLLRTMQETACCYLVL